MMCVCVCVCVSSAVNQHVTTRQQAADPARRTGLFPTSYQNNKHVIRLARSKPHIQILALSPLPQSNTVRILNNEPIGSPTGCDGTFPDLKSTEELKVGDKPRLDYHHTRQLTVTLFEQQ